MASSPGMLVSNHASRVMVVDVDADDGPKELANLTGGASRSAKPLCVFRKHHATEEMSSFSEAIYYINYILDEVME